MTVSTSYFVYQVNGKQAEKIMNSDEGTHEKGKEKKEKGKKHLQPRASRHLLNILVSLATRVPSSMSLEDVTAVVTVVTGELDEDAAEAEAANAFSKAAIFDCTSVTVAGFIVQTLSFSNEIRKSPSSYTLNTFPFAPIMDFI